MNILEKHTVPVINKDIRIQEYAPGIFKSVTTKSGIKKAIKRQEILIDGKIATTADWIKENQEIILLAPVKPSKKVFRLKLEIIYEDNYLAVINKPAGYPTSGNYFKTIENALPFNLAESTLPEKLPFPLPAHRLDNPTSGLLIIAKTRNVLAAINSDFETGKIRKTYQAIVFGKTPDKFEITDKIEGKPAITKVETLKNSIYKEKRLSFIKISPLTGRTHQIRLHLSGHGFPIVGDKIYGNPEDKILVKTGLCLAATQLEFIHPETGKKFKINIALPTGTVMKGWKSTNADFSA